MNNEELNYEIAQSRKVIARKAAVLKATIAAFEAAAETGDAEILAQAYNFIEGYVARDVAAVTAEIARHKALNEVAAILQ